VGASDNLARGESTFLVEMTETARILRSATEKSFVIMDEVGRGTSTEDGLSIARAVSEFLLNALKCRTLFATHYHELTRMEHKALKLLCMAVTENGSDVVFLRKVAEGASENSYGIHVARLAGIPDEVISRATEILEKIQSDASEKPLMAKIETEEIPQKEKNQPSLFSEDELIMDEILSCDVDNTTPLQALELLSRWKKNLLKK
jgi:DNA mismatch repair protein MutS